MDPKHLAAKMLLLQAQVAHTMANTHHTKYPKELKPYIDHVMQSNRAEMDYGRDSVMSDVNLRSHTMNLLKRHGVDTKHHETFHKFVTETPDLIVKNPHHPVIGPGDIPAGGGFWDSIKNAASSVWNGVRVALKYIAPIAAVVGTVAAVVGGIAATVVTCGAAAPAAIAGVGAMLGVSAAAVASVTATVASAAAIAGTVATVAGAVGAVAGATGAIATGIDKVMGDAETVVPNTIDNMKQSVANESNTLDKLTFGAANAGQHLLNGIDSMTSSVNGVKQSLASNNDVKGALALAEGKMAQNGAIPNAPIAPNSINAAANLPNGPNTMPLVPPTYQTDASNNMPSTYMPTSDELLGPRTDTPGEIDDPRDFNPNDYANLRSPPAPVLSALAASRTADAGATVNRQMATAVAQRQSQMPQAPQQQTQMARAPQQQTQIARAPQQQTQIARAPNINSGGSFAMNAPTIDHFNKHAVNYDHGISFKSHYQPANYKRGPVATFLPRHTSEHQMNAYHKYYSANAA